MFFVKSVLEFRLRTAKQTLDAKKKPKYQFLTLFLDIAARRASFADKEIPNFLSGGIKTSVVCTNGSCVSSFLKTAQVYL